MKNDWKINGFDGPKPLKSIEKQTLLLIFCHSQKWWKNNAKGDFESHVFWSKMATWATQVRLTLWFWTFWCDSKKSSFLDALPMDQKIEKMEPWSAIAWFCGGRPVSWFPRVFLGFPGFVDERVGHKISNALNWGWHPRFSPSHKKIKHIIGKWTAFDS